MTEQISPGERVAIFIDNEFLRIGIKATLGKESRVDYLKLCQKMASPGKMTRARLYVSPPPPVGDTDAAKTGYERWIKAMRRLPFIDIVESGMKKRERIVLAVETGELIKARYYEQKGVDVKLAIEMISLIRIDSYDVAILVAGDSDFVGLAELVKRFNRHIINAHCPPSREHRYYFSKDLERTCDRPPIILDKEYLLDCLM